MAYLLPYQPKRCEVFLCARPARVEMKDWRNESRGFYCQTHGRRKLAEREKFEREHPSLVRP